MKPTTLTTLRAISAAEREPITERDGRAYCETPWCLYWAPLDEGTAA